MRHLDGCSLARLEHQRRLENRVRGKGDGTGAGHAGALFEKARAYDLHRLETMGL
jgi:hypothetical protein